jgi:hypothetical protein
MSEGNIENSHGYPESQGDEDNFAFDSDDEEHTSDLDMLDTFMTSQGTQLLS